MGRLVGSQKNAGSIVMDVKFTLRADNKQQIIDMVGMMISAANIYAGEHSTDATVRDCGHTEYEPHKMSNSAQAMCDIMRKTLKGK